MTPIKKFEPRRIKKQYLDPSVVVLIKQIAIGVSALLALTLLLTGVWKLVRLPALTITSITAEGGETISSEEVIGRVNEALSGTYGWLIPKRFFPFYPQRELLKAVEEVERIKNVVIDRVSRTEVAITYGEYLPYALWCYVDEAEKCLFLDERGRGFAVAPDLVGGSFVRYRSVGREPETGTDILSFDDYWTTIQFIKLLEGSKLFVRSVEVDAARDVFYELVGGSELRISLLQSPEEVIHNLLTILGSDQFSHLRSDNFNYIDLRFGNKVYVNEVMIDASAATSTATSTTSVTATTSTEVN